MSKALGEEVKADSQVCADQQQSAAKKCKEVCVVGPAHAVVQPHAVVVKVFSAAIAHPAVLTAWPDIHLFGEHKNWRNAFATEVSNSMHQRATIQTLKPICHT